MPSAKVIVGRALLLVMAAAVAAVAVELTMRWFLPAEEAVSEDPFFDRSPVVYLPEPERFHPWQGGGEEPVRVAVIGDSITLGSGVQPDDSYGRRLERLLNMNAGVRPAHVLPFAKSGTSTTMQLGFLEQALTWGADVVVLGVSLNDAEDWDAEAELKAWRADMMPRVPAGWVASILRSSHLLSWAYRKVEDIRCNRGFVQYHENLYADTYSGWLGMQDALKKFAARCAGSEVAFVVIVFPHLAVDLDRDRYVFGFVHEKIVRAATDAGADCLDLFDVFEGRSPIRLQAIPKLDAHPSEIGHRIAAEALFEHLLASGVIDEAYRPVNSSKLALEHWERIRLRMREPEHFQLRDGE